jgi:hypothetical protein
MSSKKTKWSESFRDRLHGLKESFKENLKKESFESGKKTKDAKLGEMELHQSDDYHEKLMISRMTEAYTKKQESIEKEQEEKEKDNYKNRELLENLRDKDRIPNREIRKLKNIVKSFSEIHDKFEHLARAGVIQSVEKNGDELFDIEKYSVYDNEEGFEEDLDAADGGGDEPEEGFEDDLDGDEEGFEDDMDSDGDEEGFEDDLDAADGDEEGFEDDLDDADEEGFENLKEGAKSGKKSAKQKRMEYRSFRRFKNGFNKFYSELGKLNVYIPNAITYGLSFGKKIPANEKTFIKKTWYHFVAFFITLFMFLNWFYVIFFEKLTNYLVDPDVFFSYKKFYDATVEPTSFKTISNFFFKIPVQVLDLIKDTLIYFFKKLPLEWGFGLEIVIPFFLYFVYRFSSSINLNIFTYIHNALNGKELPSNLMGVILITVLGFCFYKFGGNFKSLMDTTKDAKIAGPAAAIVFILQFLITLPITVLFISWFYVYYSFFVIIVQPIKELGVFGTFQEIFDKLNYFNPLFMANFQSTNCVSDSDNCKEQGILGILYNQMIIPSFVFIVRHLLSFNLIVFLLFTIVCAFRYIKTFTLKLNLIGSLGLISLATILITRWFRDTIIRFPTSPNINENKEINMGSGPTLGAINILIYIVFASTFTLFNNSTQLMMKILVGILFMIYFAYIVMMNNHIDLGILPFVLYLLLAFSIVSYYQYDLFFNTMLGNMIIWSALIIAVLSLM